MKAKNLKPAFLVCFFSISALLSFSLNNKFDEENSIPSSDPPKKYTEKDVDEAYSAFNMHLYDPVRKIYLRDSDKPMAVGAIWTQAVYWDMAMNAYKRKKTPENRQLIEDLYEGNGKQYANYDWSNDKTWFIYDDIMWWVISMARAYELTKDPKYLAHAESGFDRVWNGVPGIDPGSYDTEHSGMFWDWTFGRVGKMSCINYPTVVAAATLYNVTKKEDYLHKAKEIYQWASENLYDPLTGRIADSKHGKGDPNWTLHVYNQGSAIGAATELYAITKKQQYLDHAVRIADYTKEVMSAPQVVLPSEKGEEKGIYTAIFAQYIVRLIEEGNKPEYLPWLRRTIDYGWHNRDQTRSLTSKNYLAKVDADDVVSCYDASGIPALMLLIPSLDH